VDRGAVEGSFANVIGLSKKAFAVALRAVGSE
jgi:hypothetical protein